MASKLQYKTTFRMLSVGTRFELEDFRACCKEGNQRGRLIQDNVPCEFDGSEVVYIDIVANRLTYTAKGQQLTSYRSGTIVNASA